MRCTPLGLLRLTSSNTRRLITLKVHHERFSTTLGALYTCNFSEFNVLECGEDRLVDGSREFYPIKSKQLLEHDDQGCLQADFLPYNKLLKKCADLGKLRQGKVLHAHFLNSEFKDDISIKNSIINMYAKCGSLNAAHKFFDKMESKDMVTWTMMIIAYTHNNMLDEALLLFPDMLRHGFKPNQFTFSNLLKASGGISDSKHGEHVHAVCIKCGCNSDVFVATSLVDMYARFGHINEAQLIFDGLPTKNEVSWNALIAGHTRNDEGEKALNLFQNMKREDVEADQFTYSSILSACASTGSLEQGKWIHAHVIKSGTILTAFVGHTLLHMYAKSGSIEDAEKVFTRLTKRNVVSWNSMLSGYAQHGLGNKTLEQFGNMLTNGLQPNAITFVCVLTACSHAGLLEQGQFYFDMMKEYGIEPKLEHYVAIVDLLGRAGKFDQALRFIRDMPINPIAEIWKALLGACKVHKKLELGAFAAERVFELDPNDSGPYVLLSNIYASAGRKSDVAKVRKMMKETRIRKEPACSWVEIENAVHMFVCNDDSHPESKIIYEMWANIYGKIKEIGYVPDTSQVLLFLDENEREATLQQHSEKLALAFALLNTPSGSTIRIKKNIRVCSDCHSAIKLTSKVINREIIVRDTNRFHHFRDGSCSCGDYW